jgi:hypothetical protein
MVNVRSPGENMRTLVAAALLAVAPAAVPAAETAPADPPRWSLGAGFTFGETVLVGGIPGEVLRLGTPVASATVERAVGPRSWLVIGLSGIYDQSSREAVALGSLSEASLSLLQVTAGLRHVVTPAGAPVDVSVLLLGGVGTATAETEYAGVDETAEASSWLVGASAGIAVDRSLTTNLSLRISTSLFDASWSTTETERTGERTVESKDLSVRLHLTPGLQLRLLF